MYFRIVLFIFLVHLFNCHSQFHIESTNEANDKMITTMLMMIQAQQDEIKIIKSELDAINNTAVYNKDKLKDEICHLHKNCDQMHQDKCCKLMKNLYDIELKKIKEELEAITMVVKNPSTIDLCKLKGVALARRLTVATQIIEDGYWKQHGYDKGYSGKIEAITGDYIYIRWSQNSRTGHDANSDIFNYMKIVNC